MTIEEDPDSRTTNSTSGIGVVIVHYGDLEFTTRAVSSVLDDPSAVNRALVVVDNAGNLPSRPFPQGVAVHPSTDNPGYGAGLNRGVHVLNGNGSFRGYLCLNNDVTLLPGFLDAASAALAEDNTGAVGGPTYRDPERTRIWYAGGTVNFALGTVRHDKSPEAAARQRTVGFIPGAAIAVNARAWQQVGGFDERFFLYHEDLDLCLRLRRRGWHLSFVPGMAAIHILGGATGSVRRSALYLEHLTRTRLRPFRPLPYRLYLAVIHSAWAVMRSAAHFANRDPQASAKARALLRGHVVAVRTILER